MNPQRQEGPHGHSINPSPDGRFAIACDLGLDKVFAHALDAGRAVLTPHRFGSTAPGAGPRHFAFHPGGRHGYSVNELDLTVTAFTFDPEAGKARALRIDDRYAREEWGWSPGYDLDRMIDDMIAELRP